MCPGATPAGPEPCVSQHGVPGSHPPVAAAGDDLRCAVLGGAAHARPHEPVLSHGSEHCRFVSRAFRQSLPGLAFLSLSLWADGGVGL